MKLSIITINYNNAEGLRRTLASVASQTYRDIEHIIIDGGSTDGSVDVIRDYENTIKQSVTINQSTIQVKWLSEKDHGIYYAMNKGIEIALGRRIVNSFNRSERSEDKNKGIDIALGRRVVNDDTSHIKHQISQPSLCDYIWILNSGDCVAAADSIERMMGVLEHTSNIPLLLGNIVKVYPNGRKYSEKKRRSNGYQPMPLNTSMLTFYTGTIPQDAAFVRKDLFEKYGLFDDTLKICADWKLYLNMIALGGVVPMYVDIDVVLFDMSGISNANNELRLAERRTYLDEVLPPSVLKDYDAHAFEIEQMNRLRRRHLYGLVYFIERVLFKLEKWRFLR